MQRIHVHDRDVPAMSSRRIVLMPSSCRRAYGSGFGTETGFGP